MHDGSKEEARRRHCLSARLLSNFHLRRVFHVPRPSATLARSETKQSCDPHRRCPWYCRQPFDWTRKYPNGRAHAEWVNADFGGLLAAISPLPLRCITLHATAMPFSRKSGSTGSLPALRINAYRGTRILGSGRLHHLSTLPRVHFHFLASVVSP